MAKSETKNGTKDSTTDKATKAKEALANAPKFKIKKMVTLPLLKPSLGIPVFIKIIDKMFQGKEIKTGDKKDMEPAMLLNILDLSTGQPCQMIANKVFESILLEEYENHSYVGVCFQVTKLSPRDGKRYNGFEIIEIELEDDKTGTNA